MLSRQVVRASVAAVLSATLIGGFGASGARAGDLYDPRAHAGSAYDDPRYADIYGDGPVRRYEPPRYEPRYDRRYDGERYYGRRYAEREDYLPPMPGVQRFGDEDWRRRAVCIDRREARDRLVDQGWHDFHDLELRGGVALITARRPSGQPYRLKLDRCTGDILNARALDGYSDSYAQRRERRYAY